MRRTSRLIPLVLALAVGLGVYLTAQQGTSEPGTSACWLHPARHSGNGTTASPPWAALATCGSGRSRRTAW